MADGISVLSFDQLYIERRRKQKSNKAKNALFGMWYGGKHFYMGLESGLTGLIQ